jgi:very-short-patch-repair endonuclease/predicted transcriptional regulator of viral defense system
MPSALGVTLWRVSRDASPNESEPSARIAAPRRFLRTPRDDPPRDDPPRDAALSRLALKQFGVVTLAQLADLGLPASTVYNRVRRGVLHRVESGVYAVGYPTASRASRQMAAVLSVGAGAVLSHWTAAAVWGLLDDRERLIHVTVARSVRSRGSIRVHQVRALPRADHTRNAGLPLTSVERTLLDLAEVAGERALHRATTQALVARLTDERRLCQQAQRTPTRRGAVILTALLDPNAAANRRRGPIAPTRSELEDRLLALVREAGLPEPRVNERLKLPDGGRPLEVDLLFEQARVIVEADGAQYHAHALARADDATRDARLQAAGYTVLRVDWHQVTRQPAHTATRLREALGPIRTAAALDRRPASGPASRRAEPPAARPA